MFACFQLLGRTRANVMMLAVGSCKGFEDFTMDPV